MKSTIAVKAARAAVASPLFFFIYLCFRDMDIEKVIEHQQYYLRQGQIVYDTGAIPILPKFWHIGFLDNLWRGATVSFAPSTLGFDPVSSWQMFSFLIDLGPFYAIWILESCRSANSKTPARFPMTFGFISQLVSIGVAAPIFYFLHIIFSPTASEIAARGAESKKSSIQSSRRAPLILPIILSLHTAQIFAMYCAPEPTTRHFWTWAWQMSPLFVGILNTLAATLINWIPSLARKISFISSPRFVLGVLALISTGTWIYTLLFSTYSLSTIFIPGASQQTDVAPHMRLGLQVDGLGAFGSSFLWMIILQCDLYNAGLTRFTELFQSIAMMPVIGFCAGPGSALAWAWYRREQKLDQRQKAN